MSGEAPYTLYRNGQRVDVEKLMRNLADAAKIMGPLAVMEDGTTMEEFTRDGLIQITAWLLEHPNGVFRHATGDYTMEVHEENFRWKHSPSRN